MMFVPGDVLAQLTRIAGVVLPLLVCLGDALRVPHSALGQRHLDKIRQQSERLQERQRKQGGKNKESDTELQNIDTTRHTERRRDHNNTQRVPQQLAAPYRNSRERGRGERETEREVM